jgi:hypothetical protein
VPDFAQAEVVHQAFGFSEFSVERDGRVTRVGRLGERYFRLVGWPAAGDPELRGFLASLDAGREVLAVLDGDPAEPVPWRSVLVSRRMSREIAGLSL